MLVTVLDADILSLLTAPEASPAILTTAQRMELILLGVWSSISDPYAWAKVAADGSLWAGSRLGHKVAKLEQDPSLVFVHALLAKQQLPQVI